MKNNFIAKLMAGPVAALAVAAVVTAGLGGLLTGCQKEDFFDPELPVEDVQPSFSKAHGLMDGPFQLTIIPALEGSKIYYTLDGSVPTAKSPVYKGPLSVSGTTIIRALERAQDGHITKVATASYIFEDVLDLDSTPAGYPEMWGPYCQIEGRAKADYAMDPLMTKDPALRQKMLAGLRQIPIVSIVTDKGNFFNDSEDPDTGGIYIHTGTPVGDGLGRGWDRPVSVEIFDGGKMDVTVDCGIRLHGGHSRLAEKNPKHAFRLKFKSEYGPSKLKYDIFGDGGPAEFNTLTLRTFFGNAWQHWDGGNRSRAQYVRDLWHRYASAALGMPYSRGRHVHVLINGMYWGIYSLSERIDENFCKSHFGGKKDDYDVIKVDEEQGNSAVADAGSFSAYAELMALDCKDMAAVEQLLDVDEFIDFMILNQYAGNTDWDYHNWYGVYNRGAAGGKSGGSGGG
ncbi:MAG: CotH kinase family protein, partial [Bacteroidales bacterium]|nr:CotH kinase family protein [Bacteroidales bacterium]